MKIEFSIVKWKNIGYGWYFYYFRRFVYVKGFTLRILIFHFRVKEKYATEKLMSIAKQHREKNK